ncbi:MAG: S8 family peptidase [Candidatus Buchananbacteria bacterium]|nr:S8 family peptidase [Candidatus Buchananbacteria bacterium]
MFINILKKSSIFVAMVFFALAGNVQAYLPSDPLYNQQSNYFDYLHMPQAWDEAKGDGVLIAILDSGVDINNPDLKFNIWENDNETLDDGIDNDKNGYIDDVSGWDFVDSDNNPSPVAGEGSDKLSVNHGTALAGIIGAVANNGLGITGIAFNSKIMPIRILKSDGEGFVANLVEAIDYAVKNGADIINLSLVGFENSTALESAIDRANKSGVLVVAASGNAESGKMARNLNLEPAYPACYGNNQNNNIVLTVSSLNLLDQKSSFSNYGSNCVDLSALGENLTSLAYYNPLVGFNDYYSYHWYGTSFSTAIVSGLAALVKSKNLSLNANDLTNLLVNNTDNIDDLNPLFEGQLGTGKINILKALNSDFGLSGKLIKLENSSAVYYLDHNQIRHLFSNQNIFFSWYSGDWTDHEIETVSQSKFDSYSFGNNVTIRPGTKLIKFQNSGRVYAVSSPNILHYANVDTLKKLYGDDYGLRLVTIQNSFESDYIQGDKLDGSTYPSSTLIQYNGSDVIWYIEDGQKREFTDDSLALNNFKDQDIIKNVSSNFYYSVSTPIKNLSLILFPYFK